MPYINAYININKKNAALTYSILEFKKLCVRLYCYFK